MCVSRLYVLVCLVVCCYVFVCSVMCVDCVGMLMSVLIEFLCTYALACVCV